LDIFLEKIVRRKKTIIDTAITAGIVVLGILLIMILGSFGFLRSFAPIFIVGIGYIAYAFIRNRSIEYEYIVTNGDLDIDMIIAQRKRKRIFSGSCKDFEMIAKLTSGQYDQNTQSIKKRIVAVSSMESSDVYFISLVKDGQKTLVFFEPHAKMIESFKKYIPRKVFD
jgi:hypothetical protein